jgi:hypothetical protein
MNGTGRLEELLEALLRHGSWLASAAIGLGFALALIDSRFGTRNLAILPNMRIATMGIVLFILLPVLRVLMMLLVFIREGDFRLAITAGLVLAIILLGTVLGFRATSWTDNARPVDVYLKVPRTVADGLVPDNAPGPGHPNGRVAP